MGTLNLLLTLAVLGYSLYSGITYMTRRSADKSALRTYQDSGTPLRDLSAEERAALQPFLVHPLKPTQPLPLKREGVFALEGPYVRHGISVQGNSTMHDTINGVEVVFPYDARDFLSDYCKAEVVFTEKYALVLRLDGGFELLAARDRATRRQVQEQQWTSGRQGELADIDPAAVEQVSEAQAGEPAAGEAASAAHSRLEILGQRDETAAEVAERSTPGLGLLPGLFFILGFVGLGIASLVDRPQRPYWWVPALACMALAAWLTWRRRSPGAPQKVNRVRGQVHAIALPVNGQVTLASVQWFIGDKFALKIPEHWRAHVLPSETEARDIDMRVGDYSLLRLDKDLSIDEEVRRFKPVFWGRHLSLFLVGLSAVLGLVVLSQDLRADLLLGWNWARHGQAQVFDTAAALEAAKLSPGSPVRLSGQARCELRADGAEQPLIDCERLRWNGEAPEVPAAEPDAATLALHSGDFIATRSNPRLEMMWRLQQQIANGGLYGSTDPYQAYRDSQKAPKLVAELARVIQTVESACQPDPAPAPELAQALAAPCRALRDTLVSALPEVDGAALDWAGWLKAANEGVLVGEREAGVMMSDELARVVGAARAVADVRIRQLTRQVAQHIQRTQRGGVVLQVTPGTGTLLPQQPGATEDSLETLRRVKAVAAAESLADFRVDALLTVVDRDPSGAPVLALDASRSLADPWPSALRVASLAIAVLLVLVHGLLLVVGWRRATSRLRDIEAFNQERLAQRPFGFQG